MDAFQTLKHGWSQAQHPGSERLDFLEPLKLNHGSIAAQPPRSRSLAGICKLAQPHPSAAWLPLNLLHPSPRLIEIFPTDATQDWKYASQYASQLSAWNPGCLDMCSSAMIHGGCDSGVSRIQSLPSSCALRCFRQLVYCHSPYYSASGTLSSLL